ncbi:peptide chain release factor N(5)-glutamine methyltransferase [Candidatus Poriferisodalis sp.]|uniref:peptide chain release factor N(5)-glutamine methyltransferase n=1 Tax=Candidatus Poriferisodalis sp. TaxID=3101277 RepID=UPI003B52C57A
MAGKDGLTLGDLYRGLREQFAAGGVTEPEVSARRIAAEASGASAAEVALAPPTPMTLRMVAHADAMAARRLAGEPLQYVLGSWGFRRLDLAVDQRALIPRPETEVVAGIAIDWLKRTVRRRRITEVHVADLGTGCGAIALSIAHEVPQARVFATDRSADALALAGANLAGLGSAATRVSLHQGDWFDALEGTPDPGLGEGEVTPLRERLDAIVANPPYVANGDVLPAEIDRWEPKAALYAGPDGLSAVRTIVRDARGWLVPGGLLVLEIASDHGSAVKVMAGARGYEGVRIEPDLAGHDRVLVAVRPHDEPDAHVIDRAADHLRAGEFVVAPTDTLCGIMAPYADTDAVARVCEAKERPRSEPMPILVSGLAQADELVELSPAARALAQQHWPGGLTLVAKRRGGPDPLHGRETLGVRAPALGWLRWLIDEVGPVTGTSANRHGAQTPASAAEAAAGLATRPGEMSRLGRVIHGQAPGGVASTVVDVTGSHPVVLRVGAVPAELVEFPLD